jgi:hypothetical protein
MVWDGRGSVFGLRSFLFGTGSGGDSIGLYHPERGLFNRFQFQAARFFSRNAEVTIST